MNALGVLFFLFQFSVLEACLVVRSTKCACPYLQLSTSNIELVSDHPFYSNLTEYEIRAPLISGDNCSISMYCSRKDDNLVVLDVDSTTNFGVYAADAFCDIEFRTWSADTDSGMEKFKRLYGVCVNFEPDAPLCTPQDQRLVFIGYSAAISRETINEFLVPLKAEFGKTELQMDWFGFVRFDVEKEEPIRFFRHGGEWIDAMNFTFMGSSPASPILDESDALKVIERFLSNTEVPVCGSRMTLLMGRPFSYSNTDKLVAELRKNRIMLYTTSILNQNGYQHIARIASMTYGYGTITERYEDKSKEKYTYELFQPAPSFLMCYCIYAVNLDIVGTGQAPMPQMFMPVYGDYMVVISSIIGLELNDVYISYSTNDIPSSTGEMPRSPSGLNYYNTLRTISRKRHVTHNMSLTYSVKEPQSVTIRVYLWEKMVDDWTSLDNVPTW